MVVALALGATLSASSSAQAQEPGDVGMAQSLFDAGRDLMDRGKPEEACPKFEESNRIDPSAGTLLNLGKCFDAVGRTASAWASYKKAITVGKSTGQSRQVTAAEEFITEIEPRLSKLTVGVKARTPGIVVRRVDARNTTSPVLISDAARDVALAVDPGEYRVEAEAPGYLSWSETVVIGRADSAKTVTVPDLALRPPVPTPTKPVARPMSPMRIAGIASGGAGVLLLGIGATLGGLTLADASTAESDKTLCPHKKCTPKGEEFVENARAKGAASTATLVIGGAALAAGAALFIVSLGEGSRPAKPSRKSTSDLFVLPIVSPGATPGAPPTFGVTLGGVL